MAAQVEDASLFTNYPNWELLPALNEIQADGLSLESKIVQIEHFTLTLVLIHHVMMIVHALPHLALSSSSMTTLLLTPFPLLGTLPISLV